MSSRYEPRGLLSLPPVKSKVTGQLMRYSARTGQYRTAASAPNPPSAPVIPIYQPAPSAASSDWVPVGLMGLQGQAAMQVFSSSNPYAGREFPVEKYNQVKRDVDYMREHPYEETLKYKIECALESSKMFIKRTKWKAQNRLRVVMFRIRRRLTREY